MNKFFLLISSMFLYGAVLSGVIAQKTAREERREQRHLEREQRRAERIAAYQQKIDSMVLLGAFEFVPQTMQRQPAGKMRNIVNPHFTLRIMEREADICLPYVKGTMPPYRISILNYSVANLKNYLTQQTKLGWQVSFSTSLFSAAPYEFTLDIYSHTGGALLTVNNSWSDPMQYSGMISEIY